MFVHLAALSLSSSMDKKSGWVVTAVKDKTVFGEFVIMTFEFITKYGSIVYKFTVANCIGHVTYISL